MLEYDPTTLTFEDFLQWVRVKFGRVSKAILRYIKVYYVDKLENWHLRVKIDDTTSLREKLSLLSNTTALDLYIMVSIEEESPVKAPCEDLLLNESSVLSGLTAST
eukprot:gene51670-69145_t